MVSREFQLPPRRIVKEHEPVSKHPCISLHPHSGVAVSTELLDVIHRVKSTQLKTEPFHAKISG